MRIVILAVVKIKAISLQSGSNGNCIYVESCGRRVLIDAGISGLQAQRRLEAYGVDIRRIDGAVITHDHSDHARSAGIFQRKFGIPIYMTPATLAAAKSHFSLGKLDDVRTFESGGHLAFGELMVETIPTPHDAADGVAMVLRAGQRSLGVLTDLGHVFAGLEQLVAGLDGVFLESNYDPDMLANGPYPLMLQRRITGNGGHLSNHDAAGLLDAARRQGRLRWACLSHLSEQNNEPQLALRTSRDVVGNAMDIHVASRYQATGTFEV